MAGTLTAPIRQSGMDADGLLLDITLAEQMAAEQLTERFDIYDSGMISYAGDVAGSMSDTLRFLFANLGWHLSMDVTVNETTDVSPSNVVDDYADVAVARRALALSFSQFAQIVDGGRILVDPMRLATSLVGSFRRGRMGQLITTGQGFATTGVDGTAYNDVDDLFTIMDLAAAAGATADMPIAMMMRNVGQWNRIRDSLRSEVGPLGYRDDIQGAFDFRPAGFTAQLLSSIYIFTTQRIAAAAGAYTGFAWLPGSIRYATGSPAAVLANAILRSAGVPMVVSWKEVPNQATNELYGNAYDGSAIVEENGWLFKGLV